MTSKKIFFTLRKKFFRVHEKHLLGPRKTSHRRGAANYSVIIYKVNIKKKPSYRKKKIILM